MNKIAETAACACSTSTGVVEAENEKTRESDRLEENLRGIGRKIMVMSGKGGVGKSSLAANIAVGISLRGKQVGLMDIDIHGPSIPTLVGLEGASLVQTDRGLMPVVYSNFLKVMSIGFLIRDRNDAVIWRAPMKHGLIKQFLTDVAWGSLDYLIVDCPPGTGDELISITQLLEQAGGAVIVTTPQDVALNDVRKSITFCKQTNVTILGVVENMSGFVCPGCKTTVDIFKSGGGEALAKEMGVPFLGKIPIDPTLVEHSDQGKPFLNHCAGSPTVAAFDTIINAILFSTISHDNG